jgi:hypothetical protein
MKWYLCLFDAEHQISHSGDKGLKAQTSQESVDPGSLLSLRIGSVRSTHRLFLDLRPG